MVSVARVIQQGRVEAVEEAVLDHLLLARAMLPGWRAEEPDLAWQLRRDRREADRRPGAGGSHRVVAAAVTEARQGVVLGEDRDSRPIAAGTTAQRAADCGGEPADGPHHRVAVPGHGVGQPRGGL